MDKPTRKYLLVSAVLVLLGVLLSGPPMVLLVHWLKPQPPWTDVQTFTAQFHWLQTLPYWFGFLLLAGNALFVAAAGQLPAVRDRIHPRIALIAIAIYGAMVSFNYALQVAYLPRAATLPADVVSALSMVNPASICWIIEMYAYAFLGIGMWLIAPGFGGSGVLNTVKWLLVANGVVSVLGAVMLSVGQDWVLSLWGLVGYAAWNLLIVVIMVLVIFALRSDPLTASRTRSRS
jgi:hypothetical protein